MIYDDSNKKWVASGSSLGLSRVHIYHNTQNNTFRVVGRKIADHEVGFQLSDEYFILIVNFIFLSRWLSTVLY